MNWHGPTLFESDAELAEFVAHVYASRLSVAVNVALQIRRSANSHEGDGQQQSLGTLGSTPGVKQGQYVLGA